MQTDQIEFFVNSLVYESDDGMWRVFKACTHPDRKQISVTGELTGIAPGSFVRASGQWNTASQYGIQFKVSSYNEVPPPDNDGIELFLASRIIKGIGAETARRIVAHFGSDTINVLDNDIERLAEISGIGKRRRSTIADSWQAARGDRRIITFLQALGLGTDMAMKVMKTLGKDTVNMVKANPYCLAEMVSGVGFRIADNVALRMGYSRENPFRCQSAVVFLLRRAADDGHVFVDMPEFTVMAAKFCDVAPDLITEACNRLIADKKLVCDDNKLYLSLFYACERGVASHLHRLFTAPAVSGGKPATPAKTPEGMAYDSLQQQAIDRAEQAKVLVLTGGPGTGKTTTINGIIAAYKACKMKVLLAAPTGRAAKRLSQATGMEARTVHRLLEYTMADGFTRNKERPLEGDALIVDECSMIDIVLFYQLVQAVPSHMRLILAGDVDQLPSVGAGNVLADIIQSDTVPVVRLTRIFRQAMHSRIITNAHAINAGNFPDISNGHDSDFFFMTTDNEADIARTICSLAGERLPRTYGVTPDEIQVLTPMTRGDSGTANLNALLQDALNASGTPVKGTSNFRIGDKVMQTRNNYEKNVFNGDIGTIVSGAGKDCVLSVDFDGRKADYSDAEVDELTPAYAVTVHKSQGSEFPIVIIPVVMSHRIMLQRNLIYTAITRAKRICVLVGQKNALAYAIENRPVAQRNSLLDKRLRDIFSEC